MKYEILSSESFKHDHIDVNLDSGLTRLGGCLDDGKEYGLAFYEHHFLVKVTNDNNETKEFTLIYQLDDRTDNMRAYSGYELSLYDGYDVVNFCDGDDSIVDELEKIAKAEAEEYLEELLGEVEK